MRHLHKQIWAVLLLVLLSCVPTATHAATQRCFAETSYCIDSTFAPFWQKQGDLAVFGYPIAPASTQIIEGIPVFAQYFERARLEVHLDRAGNPQITLGRIGAELRGQIEYQGAPGDASCLFFAQTNQSVCAPFRTTYLSYGLETNGKRGVQYTENLALFGVPISAPQRISMPDGEYVSQWFERAEMRYRSDTPTVVTLGLIGVARLAQASTPPASATPITADQPLTFAGTGSFLSAPIPLPRGEITLTISKNSNATVQLIDGRGRIQTVYNNFNLTNLTPSIYNDTGGDWYLVISGTNKYWTVSLAVSAVNQALAFQYGGTGTVDSDTFSFDKTQTGLYSVHYSGSGYFLMQMRCNGKTTTLVSMTNGGDAQANMPEVPGICRWVINGTGKFIINRLQTLPNPDATVTTGSSTMNQSLAFQYGGTGSGESDAFSFDKTQMGLYSVHYSGSGYFYMQMRCNDKTTTLVRLNNSGDALAVMQEVPGICRWVISGSGSFIIYRLKTL